MKLCRVNNIEKVWANICRHQGETFFTVARKKSYTYTIKNDYIIISNNTKRGRITKEMIERALSIENPNSSKISGWAPSYICGIITDKRIAMH